MPAINPSRLLLGARPRRTLLRCVILAVVCFVLFRYVFALLRLDGSSMEPNYSHGSIVLANRLAYAASEPRRGDVVALRLRESGGSVLYLKRVVGLPGERIGFRDGRLLVDGVVHEEPYLVYDYHWDREPVLCEANEYFLVGDNRAMPMQQHSFGRTRCSLILGKVLF